MFFKCLPLDDPSAACYKPPSLQKAMDATKAVQTYAGPDLTKSAKKDGYKLEIRPFSCGTYIASVKPVEVKHG